MLGVLGAACLHGLGEGGEDVLGCLPIDAGVGDDVGHEALGSAGEMIEGGNGRGGQICQLPSA